MFEKESFYPSAALNCAITDTSVSFDPQLPLGNKAGTSLSPESDRLIPPGIMMLKGGKMRPKLYGAGHKALRQKYTVRSIHLEKGDDGVWSTVADGGCGGFCPVVFRVDGAEVLNPIYAYRVWRFKTHKLCGYSAAGRRLLPVQRCSAWFGRAGILLFGSDGNDEELPCLYACRLYERNFR